MAATVGWRPRCCLSHGELRPCRRVHCSRDPACLLLGCKLLWLCNSEDSRTFSMKTKIVIFFLWWNLLSLKFHQVFSSKFPLYGMLILFHKKVHLVRKKRDLRLSVYCQPRTWSQFSDVWKAFVCRLGCLDFLEGQIFLGSLGRRVGWGVAKLKRLQFCVFDPKSHPSFCLSE